MIVINLKYDRVYSVVEKSLKMIKIQGLESTQKQTRSLKILQNSSNCNLLELVVFMKTDIACIKKFGP